MKRNRELSWKNRQKKPAVPEQHRAWTCGPSVVLGVLQRFGREWENGRRITEEKLIPICHATEQSGTSHFGLKCAFRSLRGFHVETGMGQSPNVCWRALHSRIGEMAIIVNIFANNDGHYSIITRLWERGGKRYIELADPRFHQTKDRRVVFGWNEFLGIWFSFRGGYPIGSRSFYVRWWMGVRAVPKRAR